MATAKVIPTVLTLNAALETVATIPVNRLAREAASKLLAEFKAVGVEPCLATYYHILRIFCRESIRTPFLKLAIIQFQSIFRFVRSEGPVSNVLVDILQELEKGIPPIQDLLDVAFFPQAMDVCHHHLQNVDLARRLDALLNSRPEYNVLIGDSFKESIY